MQAYDSHCNLVLGEVEETIYTIDEDEEGDDAVRVCFCAQLRWTCTDTLQTQKKQSDMLFVRGM
jgi:U6 snRNA-associated Sm-like protein LSm3